MTPEPFTSAALAARLNDLEERYTHLQRIVEDLNAVVVLQDQRIDQLERKNILLASQLITLSDRDPEPRTLEEEKPPHY